MRSSIFIVSPTRAALSPITMTPARVGMPDSTIARIPATVLSKLPARPVILSCTSAVSQYIENATWAPQSRSVCNNSGRSTVALVYTSQSSKPALLA